MNGITMMMLLQQQQSQPVSALRGGGMMGSSPGHRIGGLKIAAASEALINPAPHQNKRLYAPGLLNARVSNDNQVPNAEDVVAEHPLRGYIVPVQAAADDEEHLAANKGVELLQEGSDGGGGTDVETHVTSTCTNDFNGNGGAFVAPVGGGSVDSAMNSEEEAFPMGGADIRGVEKVCDTTASLALRYASLRLGGKTPALLSTLVTGAGALSVVAAATTSCFSAGMTSAEIGSSKTTSVPGDLADDATWALFSWITNIGAATALAWSMRVFALWVLATLACWARRRNRSRSRKKRASVSPNAPPTAVGTPAAAAAAAAAPAMPPAGTPPAAAAAPPGAAAAMAAPAPSAPAAAAVPAVPAPGAPPAVAVPAVPAPAPPAPAAAASTASNPVDSHAGTPGSPAPASTGPAQPVANAPAAPEPEPRVGRGRKLLRCLRAVPLCSCMVANVNEAASHVGEALSDVADALGHVVG
ncbi:unnamed protein product [Ectocarpus sp. CCAP 1310/34]|nr:unnamed protein product [Ectocarpus sp. CCAP 1310/34]